MAAATTTSPPWIPPADRPRRPPPPLNAASKPPAPKNAENRSETEPNASMSGA